MAAERLLAFQTSGGPAGPRRRRAARAAALAWGLFSLLPVAQAAITATGSVGTAPSPFALGPADVVQPTGTAYVGSPGTGHLQVDGGSLLQLATLNFGSGGAGNGTGLFSGAGTRVQLLGDGFAPSQIERLRIGDWGSGQLTVNQGATLDTSGNQAPCLLAFHYCDTFVGSAAGDTAVFNIDGVGTRARIGQYLFVAQPGLAVPAVDGYTYGNPGGTTRGTVNITGGAALVTDRVQVAPRHWSTAATGHERNLGEVNVTGTGSRWEVVGGPLVNHADGTVNEAGAYILTANDRNSWATVNVTQGGVIEVQGTDAVFNSIGLSTGGGRTDMLVSGVGSRVTFASASGVFQVGRSLGSAQLDVRDGAVVDRMYYASVGRDGSFGTLNIDGSGSLFRVDNTATAAANGVTGAAAMEIGRNGTGVVRVSNGARLEVLAATSTTNGMGFNLGRDAASSGTLNIDSGATVLLRSTSTAPGSAAETWNPLMRIGRDGSGTLNISSGGVLRLEGGATSTVANTRRTNLFIGGNGDATIGGRGMATVSGAGSALQVTGSDAYIAVGHGPQAVGTLVLANGASASSTILGVGNFGATGVLTVDAASVALSGRYTGAGEFGAALVIGAGENAVGNATLRNGASVVITNNAGGGSGVTIGGSSLQAGGDGSLTLNASSLQLAVADNSGGMTVGRSGSGLLRLQNGSTVDLGGNALQVGRFSGSDGSLLASGGSVVTAGWVGVGRNLDPATGLSADGGTATMVLNGATLNAQDVVIGTNGYLGGTAGAINVSGTVTNYGTFSPGSSPGVFTLNGNFVAAAGSRLILEVQADGLGGFNTDLLRFGDGSFLDLAQMSVEFRFLGDTDPLAFQSSGAFDIDTFLVRVSATGAQTALDHGVLAGVRYSARADSVLIADFSFDAATGAQFSVLAVPEPGTWALWLLGLGGLSARAWFRRGRGPALPV